MDVIETPDHALIVVESQGHGRPLVLVHGWTMSSAWWRRQVEGLSDWFQVVTPDLRAHGRSSKVLHNHTVPQYARDVRAVIESMDLREVVLAGWSLAGPVVLDYWRQYGADRIHALALVEMTPWPMSPGEWNTHALKGRDFDGLNRTVQGLSRDRQGFGEQFVHRMFAAGQAPQKELEWMSAEHLKTPTPAAAAVYTDYVMRDCRSVLGTITVPTLVANGDSPHMCFGPRTGRFVAESIPGARLEIFDQSGHMPFYEEPERFNRVLAELAA
ncbi:MAG: alpha/beta hydrolase [Proteobacteria bacterium]|nr:alpha/beta hydrolase [Pseudomonadota bacterium]MBU1740609.1 alpha/beta hydrolase [Pseudomonadota bacterium]